jgi:hypothetical protein
MSPGRDHRWRSLVARSPATAQAAALSLAATWVASVAKKPIASSYVSGSRGTGASIPRATARGIREKLFAPSPSGVLPARRSNSATRGASVRVCPKAMNEALKARSLSSGAGNWKPRINADYRGLVIPYARANLAHLANDRAGDYLGWRLDCTPSRKGENRDAACAAPYRPRYVRSPDAD